MSLHNRNTPVAVAVAAALLAASSTVTAQEEQPAQEVIVTGSRIARPNLEASVPITTVTGEELFQTGTTSVGDLLSDLPALRSTISQSNSQRFLGTAGLNLLDLRGLGTQRTLTLVNGRRHVGGDILSNAVSPDINTFPTDLIDRIDVVTGGNSAVYGSDAIAGVVNFVLKRDFEGLQFRAQGGQSKYNDAGDYYASILAGTNFMDGRGNIAANIEYAKQEALLASERPNMRSQGVFVVTDTDPSGIENGSDGVPDRFFFSDVRSATTANGGLISIAPRANSGLAPCGRDANGAAFNCTFLFQPDGSLVPQSGTRIGISPNGSFDGGNGTSSRERNALGIFPKLDRTAVNLFGHLTLSDAFEPFVEAKYVRTKSLRSGTAPFFQGTTLGSDVREQLRFDNPFLSDATRAQITAAYTQMGQAAPTATTRFALRRSLLDIGPRREDATRETSRIVLGVGGKFAEDWSYEVAVNYGRFDEDTDLQNNYNRQRLLLALDSARDGAGNIVCRSKIDPAAAVAYNNPSTTSVAYANATLAADIAACVPLNPFGDGSVTPAMRDYLTQGTTTKGKITQFVQSASISGSSRQWFELPAGPIGVAFGLEHRTEENFLDTGPLVQSGITFYNVIAYFDPPKFEVSEAFTEFRVPVLAEMPFAQELTINLAGRYADYQGKTGGVFAYNYGFDWAPIESVRFRVGKARAVRAPNLSDLWTLPGQNFAGNFNDPCSARNIGTGSATRAANCAAAGRPANYDYVYTASLGFISGGNPALKEETSDSFTAGVVFRPEGWGFSASIDYFDIDIDDVITAPSAQDILNACYDSATLDNQFCRLFQRAGAGGGPGGEIPFRVLEGSMQQITLNYARRNARGIDVEAAYAREIGSLGRFGSRLVYTHSLARNDFLDPTNPAKADMILSELGDPRNAFNLNFDLARGPLTLGYELRYLGPMALDSAENYLTVQGRAPQNADFANRLQYPSVIYHDVRAGYDFTNALNAYVGIDNVANKEPPLGLVGSTSATSPTTAQSSIYNVRGRFFFAGARYKF
jgi:outer membrane receptor protein involved in Fe transport